MTDYAEAALAVRRAREARDAAADDLYQAQLHGLALDAARQREARGEGVFDPAAESTLRRLQGEQQKSVARRQAVTSRLERFSYSGRWRCASKNISGRVRRPHRPSS